MAYFDSEKNRAMWQKRLATLEKERDRRKMNGYRPNDRRAAETSRSLEAETPGVRTITFEQLVAKEEQRHKEHVRLARAARQREMQLQNSADMRPEAAPHR
ncbi:MAG: hypothetical protein J5969_09985 [Lachnospiraceae bacterium]|nr:hypothetical protein [Lachnospiraceae bacterium]